MDSGRVPSYKAIAIAILKNDYYLHSLGFSQKQSRYYYALKEIENSRNSVDENNQQELFF